MKFLIFQISLFLCFVFSGDAQETTFADVFPIFEEHCSSCHQPGHIGPMPLTNYEEISAYGQMINHVVSIGYMPPFLPSKNYDDFLGNRRLTDIEIAKIESWANDGFLIDSAVISRQNRVETPLADFDLTYTLSDSFEHYGVYYDQYRVFVVPSNLKSDTFVRTIKFDPGADAIVRHVSISIIIDSLQTDKWDRWDPNLGYFSFGDVGVIPFESRWYNWRPGQLATQFKNDEIKYLPKGAIFLVHVHYGPAHHKIKDYSQLKLKFSSNKTDRRISQPLIHSGTYTKPVSSIEPNERFKIHAQFRVPETMTIYGIMPHAHFLCRDWEIFVKRKNGVASLSLLNIEDWDFNWKEMYRYKNPIQLNPGDVIHVLSTFDNTANNLSNPSDPPAKMEWGKRMFEEMMLVFFDYSIDSASESADLDLLNNATIIGGNRFSYQFSLSTAKTLAISAIEVNSTNQIFIAQPQLYAKGHHKIIVTLPEKAFGNYFISFRNEHDERVKGQIVSFVDSSKLGVWSERH